MMTLALFSRLLLLSRLTLAMSLNRRQLLLGSLILGGGGLAVFASKIASQISISSPPTAIAPASPLGTTANPSPPILTSVKATNPAPKGLFAPVKKDVRIVVISDLNSSYGSTTYDAEVTKGIALIPDWQPDLVLCGGDMVAGQSPSLTPDEIKAMWRSFEANIAAPLRQKNIPFGFTIGNHDASAALGVRGQFLFQGERDLASAYWKDPQHNPGLQFVDQVGFPFYYTFQQQDIFYLVWDASTSKIPTEQIAWAERSLASPAAQNAKFRIAIGHLPLYAVAVGRDELGEILNNADQLRSLLERYKVHTYISGHNHAYYPAHKGQLQLLHTGILGSGPRPLLNSNLPTFKTITVLDVDLKAGDTTYTTYDMKTMELVDIKTLPRLITGPTGTILRRDLETTDLTPQEKSLTFTPSS